LWFEAIQSKNTQNNKSKWTGGVAQAINRAPALQVLSPKFKPQFHQKKKMCNRKEKFSGGAQ
jgi:hypothetical protein